MSATASRYYALAMAFTNLMAAFLLLMMCIVNSTYGSPNLLVTLLGPLVTAVFAIISIMWIVDAFVRRGRRLRVTPGEEAPGAGRRLEAA